MNMTNVPQGIMPKDFWERQYRQLLSFLDAPCGHCGKKNNEHYCYFQSPESTKFDPNADVTREREAEAVGNVPCGQESP